MLLLFCVLCEQLGATIVRSQGCAGCDKLEDTASSCASAVVSHLAAGVGGLVARAGDDDERLGLQGFERRGRPQRRLGRRNARAQLRAHLCDRRLDGAAGLCAACVC